VNILLLMIPLSLLFMGGAVMFFFWAVDHDQFDDLETPGLLPLDDSPEREARPRAAIAWSCAAAYRPHLGWRRQRIVRDGPARPFWWAISWVASVHMR
jgi:cbb3-type cytochrome oxidase maturation protein